jgi:hypothetical protein
MSRSYALASLEAYRAYGGDEYHQKARDIWGDIQTLQVSSADVASGKFNGTSFLSHCYGRMCILSIQTSPLQFLARICYGRRAGVPRESRGHALRYESDDELVLAP